MSMNKLLIISLMVCSCWTCAWSQPLQVVVQHAIENNATLEAAELEMKMTKIAVDEAWKLPDLKVGYGWFASEPQTRTGSQEYKVSVQQMLPWFGVLNNKKNVAKTKVQLSHSQLLLARRKLIFSVSRGYYNLFALQQKIRVTNHYIEWLEDKRGLILNRLQSNKGNLSDVLLLDMRVNDLKQMVVEVKAEESSMQASMRTLTNEEDTTRITTDDLFLHLPDDPEYVPELLKDVDQHPVLKQIDAMMHIVDGQVKVNNSSNYPNIAIGMDYINIKKRTDMVVPNNGDDIYMLMVSFSIPLWNKSKSVAKRLAMRQRQLQVDRRQKSLELRAELLGAVSRKKAAMQTFTLQNTNRLTAQRAAKLALANIVTVSDGVERWIDWLRLEQEAEWKMIQAAKTYYMESALVLYLVQ